MNQLLSRITSLWKIWWKNLWFARKAENVLSDWFDVSTATEIWESDLMKIFANRIKPATLPFFIISTHDNNIPKRKFDTNHIDECYGSDWYAYIHPNSWSDIIIPSQEIRIRYNSKKQYSVNKFDWLAWWHSWWTFQLDKNYGKQLIHTQVSIQAMQTILEQALS